MAEVPLAEAGCRVALALELLGEGVLGRARPMVEVGNSTCRCIPTRLG